MGMRTTDPYILTPTMRQRSSERAEEGLSAHEPAPEFSRLH